MALSRRDITLLLLMGGPVEGITRMQKYLFLSLAQEKGEMVGVADVEGFEPYRFGPYSSELYDDLEMLENLGLITSQPVGELSEPETEEVALSFEYLMGDDEQDGALAEQEEKRYELTEGGLKFVQELVRPTEDQVEGIRRVKSKFAHYSLRALLRYVYRKYPEWTKESEIAEEIL